MASEALVKLVVATAEVMGAELSLDGARLMCEDLTQHPEPQVIAALARCRRELRGRFTLAEVLARIDDGRPSAEEAWAMVPRDEHVTAVLTEEIAEAAGIARPLLDEGDPIAARMAFRDAYARIVARNKQAGIDPSWFASLGWDKAGRAMVLAEAVRLGRLSAPHALELLPPEAQDTLRQLAGPEMFVSLPAPSLEALEHEEVTA